MKNSEFIIKKDAFITCFTPFFEHTSSKIDVIAYSALTKQDIKINFDKVKYTLPKIGIYKLNIVYIIHQDFDEEFHKEIMEFDKKSSKDSNYIFTSGILEGYFEYLKKGYINVYKGDFNTQNSLFIFYGFNWSEIVFLFKKHLDINISGGSLSKRHLLSHLVLRLNSYLLGFTLDYNVLNNSIVFDNLNKDKILPKFNFKNKNTEIGIEDIDKIFDISSSEKKEDGNLSTNRYNKRKTNLRREFHNKALVYQHPCSLLKERRPMNLSLNFLKPELNILNRKYSTQKNLKVNTKPIPCNILPALNSANCWKNLYNLSKSAGILRKNFSYMFFRDYTPKIMCYTRFYSINRSSKDKYHCIQNIEYNTKFASYLTGLIEGDGSIIVPKLFSEKGKRNYSSVQIVFNSKDFPLALMIQSKLKHGSISKKKGVNAYILSINNFEGLVLIVSLINGYMRTPKIYALYRLIDWLNNHLSLNLEKKDLDSSSIDSNSWLAGFIDADGHFSIRTSLTSKYPRIECKFELVQRQIDHNKRDNFDFLNLLADYLCTNVKKTRISKPKPEYRVRTYNIKGNIILRSYLNSYPLFSSKYLDSKDWMKIFLFFESKSHTLPENRTKIVNIKLGMNNGRKEFNWDHLNMFYNLCN